MDFLFKKALSGASDAKYHRIRGTSVIIGGLLIHFTLGVHYTIGNMNTYISSYIRARVDPTWTYASASWFYTAAEWLHGPSMVVGGYFEYKFGPQIAAFIGCVLFTAGVTVTYFTLDSPILAIVTYGAFRGFKGFPYGVTLNCGMKWFPHRKAFTAGLILSAYGLASFFLTPMQTAFMNPSNIQAVHIPPDPPSKKYFLDEGILNRVPDVFLLMGGLFAVMQTLGCLLLANPDAPEPAPSAKAAAGDDATSAAHDRHVDGSDDQRETNKDGAGHYETTISASRQKQQQQQQHRSSSSSMSNTRKSPGAPAATTEDAEAAINRRGDEQKSTAADMMEGGGYDDDAQLRITNGADEAEKQLGQYADDGDVTGNGSSSSTISNLSPKTVLRTRQFWMLFFTFFCNQQSIGFISNMYKVYGLGIVNNDAFLAAVGSAASVGNAAGRPTWGAVADRIGYKYSMMMITGGMTFLFATLPLTKYGGKFVYAAWIVALNMLFGGHYSLMPSCTVQTFGPLFGSANYGLVFAGSVVSATMQSIMLEKLIPILGDNAMIWITSGFSVVCFAINTFYDKNPSPDTVNYIF